MSKNPKLKKNGGQGTAIGNALRFLVKQGKTISPKILDLAGELTGIESLKDLGDAIKGDDGIVKIDKDLLLRELELDMQGEVEITKRWVADSMSDSWMSKNIRPYTLAFLLVSMFIFIMLDSSIEGFKISSEWIDLLKGLLMTAVGGYFVIRGGEKMMDKFKRK
jgi:hypothetical protein